MQKILTLMNYNMKNVSFNYYDYFDNYDIKINDPLPIFPRIDNNPKTGDPMCLKVMHQAGGAAATKLNREHGGLREWMKTVIAEEPLQYINKVTS